MRGRRDARDALPNAKPHEYREAAPGRGFCMRGHGGKTRGIRAIAAMLLAILPLAAAHAETALDIADAANNLIPPRR